MFARKNLTRPEMEILRYVIENAPTPARDIAEHMASQRGHARTTTLTVLERLRNKGYVDRSDDDGVFRYSPAAPRDEMQRSLVSDFVEIALGGSITPFAAYLSKRADMSEEELEDLKKMIAELDARSDSRKRSDS